VSRSMLPQSATPDGCGSQTRGPLDGNDTGAQANAFPPRKNGCVHELFEAQAHATPDAIAVEFEERQLTYAQLNRRADELGKHLRRLGAGPERLVAVCLDRSLEMVVALLGILKSGGAYVPLDPSHPAERLRFMLEDSRAALVLTNHNQEARLNELGMTGLRILRLDDVAARTFPPAAADEEDKMADRNGRAQTPTEQRLMYVIYTSGSTGRPKGVEIPHRAVVNFLESMRREPGLTAADTLLAVTSISFDIAGLEIFLPLVAGGRVVVAGSDTIFDESRLAALIRKSGATVLQATPSLWRVLVESGWPGESRLKILCGGESLSRKLADDLLKRGAEVWNLYGPTETTIWSALCRVEPGPDTVPIGRPIAHTQLYVLDRQLQPVPIGIAGELYIGGDGLARGYLNQPELTAERFIHDPFAQPGAAARLYRTGDIARYRPDGRIECLGRADDQVKLRGHRIDLGEIETTLRQRPDVREAVVVLRDTGSDRNQLVAYLACVAGARPETVELRRFLKGRLPDYMVPGAFVALERLPTTPNGKIDRKALPAPATDRAAQTHRALTPPRTSVEQTLAGIWRDVLRLDEVGVHDNFFELGGHSLLAMQMMSRLSKAFQAELSLRSIFESPTIAGLAQALDGVETRSAAGSIPRAQSLSQGQARALLGRLDELSDQEVESLLQQVGPETGGEL